MYFYVVELQIPLIRKDKRNFSWSHEIQNLLQKQVISYYSRKKPLFQ